MAITYILDTVLFDAKRAYLDLAAHNMNPHSLTKLFNRKWIVSWTHEAHNQRVKRKILADGLKEKSFETFFDLITFGAASVFESYLLKFKDIDYHNNRQVDDFFNDSDLTSSLSDLVHYSFKEVQEKQD